MKKPTYSIEVLDVWFIYNVGQTYIVVTTKPDPEIWRLLPDHMKVCFGFATPPDVEITDNPLTPGDEIERAVSKAIREKIAEQKQTGEFPRNLPEPPEKKKKKRKAKYESQ